MWDRILKTLRQMRPTGADGFEGVAAALLENLTGERFFVAHGSNQPRGDSRSESGATSVQAKRYGEGTRPDRIDLLHDLERIASELPQLEVYCIVTTRVAEQFVEEAHRSGRERGIDVVVLAENDHESSDLAVLCATFWDDLVRRFDHLRVLGVEAAKWAAETRDQEPVQDHVERLRRSVVLSAATLEDYKRPLNLYLNSRFGRASSSVDYGSPISLPHAVE